MKTFALLFLIVFCVSPYAEAKRKLAATIDCATAKVRYRKAPQNDLGSINLRTWACAAYQHVPEGERDTNPEVRKCVREMVLYKEVNAGDQFCIYLDDAEEKERHHFIVKLRGMAYIPTYQSTSDMATDPNSNE